jgi:transcriptional regulator with XRE-family HTH domain
VVPPKTDPPNRPAANFEAVRLAAQVRRQELGLSLKQLFRRAGIAESTVNGALYGYHEGSVRTWWAIAHGLDMPVGDLLNHLDDQSTTDTVPPSTTIT